MNPVESEISHLRSEVKNLKNELLYAQEQLAWFKRQVFGKRSEKLLKDLDPNTQYLDGFEDFLANNATQATNDLQVVREKGRDKTT